jgi:hypothetical protein
MVSTEKKRVIMKKEHGNSAKGQSTGRGRNWNLMLVDDHGRIIPFKRIKGIAFFGIFLLIAALFALAVSGYWHMRQIKRMQDLSAELKQLKQKAANLRDEKDILLAQLVTSGTLKVPQTKTSLNDQEHLKDFSAQNQIQDQAGPPETESTQDSESDTDPAAPEPAEQKTEPVPQPSAKAPKPAEVAWKADIRRFVADYKIEKSLLQASLRIYNTSSPKKQLAGHVVVVFKNTENDPSRWVVSPPAQLIDGVPDGKTGKPFKINNYLTMRFREYDQRPPVVLNSASVYVFTDQSDLIHVENFDLNINVQPADPSRENGSAQAADRLPAAQPEQPKGQGLSSGQNDNKNGSRTNSDTGKSQFAPADQLFLPEKDSGLPWLKPENRGPGAPQKNPSEHPANDQSRPDQSIQGEQS